MSSFVVDGRPVAEGRVAAVRVVPAFDPLKHRHLCFRLRLEPTPAQQLALEGGEETLRHRIVCALEGARVPWVRYPPATLAPAGSTWSGPGGDEWSEALQENPSVRREAKRVGRNENEHCAGPEMIAAEADPP